MMEGELLASQASSHFPLEPVRGDTLFALEVERKRRLRSRGNVLTGCPELDEYVLLGGLQRGCVVGISAEQEEMGLLVSFVDLEAACRKRGRLWLLDSLLTMPL